MMSSTPEVHRLIPLAAVLDRTSLSDATIRRMVDAGSFPKPVKPSPNRKAWREADVNAWIATRVEAA